MLKSLPSRSITVATKDIENLATHISLDMVNGSGKNAPTSTSMMITAPTTVDGGTRGASMVTGPMTSGCTETITTICPRRSDC